MYLYSLVLGYIIARREETLLRQIVIFTIVVVGFSLGNEFSRALIAHYAGA